MRLSHEARRRQAAGLSVTGRWTFTCRAELKNRGFIWDGEAWLAPDEPTKIKALADLSHTPPDLSWSVTIHGDAGFKNGIGRWAWLCRSSLPPRYLTGEDQGPCPSVEEAEARALLHGLQATLSLWTPPPTPGTLYLRSDSQAVIEAIQRRSTTLPPIQALLKALPPQILIDAKHVPGHGRAKGTARWANNRVDLASNLRGILGDKRIRGE
jgi:ribonuclease HI